MIFAVVFMAVLTVLYVVFFGAVLAFGRDWPTRAATRFAARCRLPLDGPSATEVPRRLRARWLGTFAGSVIGFAAGLGVMLLTPPSGGLIFIWWSAGGILGASLGALVVHVRALRTAARRATTRSATLAVRRADDYLTTPQRIVPYVALVLPVLAVVVGVSALAAGSAPAPAAVVVVAGVLGVVATAGMLLVQRYALHVPAPAGTALELQWEEALRSMIMRDLFSGTYCIAFTLGAVEAFSAARELASVPAPLVTVTGVALLLAFLGLLWASVSTSAGTRTAARFQRHLAGLADRDGAGSVTGVQGQPR